MSRRRPVIDLVGALAFVLAGAALLWAATLFLQALGHRELNAQASVRLEEAPDPVVDAYRAEQQDLLERGRWIDRGAGTVQLPIERAMELVVQENQARSSR